MVLKIFLVVASFSKKDWQKTIEFYEQAEKKTVLKDLSVYEFGYAYFQNQVYFDILLNHQTFKECVS